LAPWPLATLKFIFQSKDVYKMLQEKGKERASRRSAEAVWIFFHKLWIVFFAIWEELKKKDGKRAVRHYYLLIKIDRH
jgi:hypothetical protein